MSAKPRGRGRNVSRTRFEHPAGSGKQVIVELRRGFLAVRPRYAREEWRVQFSTIYDLAAGQATLRLA